MTAQVLLAFFICWMAKHQQNPFSRLFRFYLFIWFIFPLHVSSIAC